MTKSKIKILIVEDERTLLEMYKIKFENENFEVFLADNGETGIEIAKNDKPDLIMLDIMMPKMDGFAALKELKDDAKTKKIPVIMLTNLGQEEDLEKGKKFGAADYIIKANSTPAQVVDKVRKVLKK